MSIYCDSRNERIDYLRNRYEPNGRLTTKRTKFILLLTAGRDKKFHVRCMDDGSAGLF